MHRSFFHRGCAMHLLGLSALLLAVAMPVGAQNASEGDAVRRCEALVDADLSRIPDAPTKITQARWVAKSGTAPAYCEVQGYVSPNVGIEMRLPATTWNGKFLKAGCGGFCGVTNIVRICEAAVERGYACIASDMGHRSTPTDGVWAYNNLQAKVDWGFRATHVATLAGKAIVARYFDSAPKKSYYFGCSTGGRQGLVQAQRFPWDFDGIIAGAAPIEHTRNNLAVLWNMRAVRDENDKYILTPDDVQLVHQAVLAKCDAGDGLKDGILEDPRACKFDPAELACRAGSSDGCLSAPKVDAVRKLYSGPVTFPEEHSTAGMLMRGSELEWIGMYLRGDGERTLQYRYQSDKMRYTAFMPDAGPQWELKDLDFAVDPKRFIMESLYTANNPDLRKLKQAGAKLLYFQGWSDQGDFPLAATDYYETAERVIGSREQTQDFFRLFMVPGMGHCSGGAGAYYIDYLSYMEEWAEKGRAPDKLVGVHPKDPAALDGGTFGLRAVDPAQVKFTRPIYPYPTRARYSGRGDPNDAASFKPVQP